MQGLVPKMALVSGNLGRVAPRTPFLPAEACGSSCLRT